MTQEVQPQAQPAINLQQFYAGLVTGLQKLLRDYSHERQRLRQITSPTPDTCLVEAEGTLGSLGEENAALNLRVMQYVGLVFAEIDNRFRTLETALAELDADGGGERPPLDDEEAQAILELSALAEGLAKQNLEASPGATAEAKATLNHIIELAQAVHTIAIDASDIEDGDAEGTDTDSNGAGAN